MLKKSKKVTIFSLLLFSFLFLSNGLVFAQTKLEVEYPEIQGLKPETTAVPLPEYVKYIFNFTIAIIGIVGLGALIIGGIRYLTSAGNLEKIKNAKKQVRSAFLGILILLFSYLILTTLNPQLVIFRQPVVEPTPPAQLPVPPISEATAPDLLTRIGELAELINGEAYYMKNNAAVLIKSIEKCDCNTTQSLCLCKNYYGTCDPDNVNPCYSAKTTQPCPEDATIKGYQLVIASQRDNLLYYRNRALGERQDLTEDIEKVLKKKIDWYAQQIAAEKEVLEQMEEGPKKEAQQKIIEALEEEKGKLEKEKGCKEELKPLLLQLADAIWEMKNPATNLTELPDKCLENVPKKCQGSCSGGCHDTLGCFPAGCKGGNPCPVGEINSAAGGVTSGHSKIYNNIVPKIREVLKKIKEGKVCLPGLPPVDICQTPEKLAQENNNAAYPRKRADSLESLLNCITKETGQALPAEGGSNQFYGSLYTYEHTNELCNYTRGKTTCGNCSHALYSCHYGGSNGTDGALAIDFGNEKNGNKIISASLKCGAKSARCENASGQTVNCSNSSADHIHINDKNCDKN